MTTETEALLKILRAMKTSQIALPEYSADPKVRSRVGKMLVESSAHVPG